MAVGNAQAIRALSIIKTNIDSGQFKAIQEVAVGALQGSLEATRKQAERYARRRKIFIDGLNELGWELPYTQATFYVWAPIPTDSTSQRFCTKLLQKTGVLVVPGNGYGKYGEGYFRASITIPEKRLTEAVRRMKRAGIVFRK